jgi:hypothetical protein
VSSGANGINTRNFDRHESMAHVVVRLTKQMQPTFIVRHLGPLCRWTRDQSRLHHRHMEHVCRGQPRDISYLTPARASLAPGSQPPTYLITALESSASQHRFALVHCFRGAVS